MCHSDDPDGAVRLTLLGGLDIVVADRLAACLHRLRAPRRLVRVDLSQLEFIDCTGLEAILAELADARCNGREIEIDRPVSAPVKRVISFLDVVSVLWPAHTDRSYPPVRVVDPLPEETAARQLSR